MWEGWGEQQWQEGSQAVPVTLLSLCPQFWAYKDATSPNFLCDVGIKVGFSCLSSKHLAD